MIDVNNFHYMKIGLASPEKSVLGLLVKLKPETINYRTLKPEKMVYSVKEFSDLQKTGNINTNVFATKAWSVTDVELK